MKPRSGEAVIRASLIDTLPPPNTKRWVIRRKAAVVAAVRSGGITMEEVCRTYGLSEEEFLSWDRALESHGLAGLRVTRIKQYRASHLRESPFGVAETADRPDVVPPESAGVIVR